MKKKISRILGVGITVALLASMMVMVAPAAPAAAGTLEYGPFPDYPPFPSPATPSFPIIDMAVNGSTIYAAGGVTNWSYIPTFMGPPYSPLANATGFTLIKSVDGGGTWVDLARTTDFPTTAGAPDAVKLVAVAPDDPNVVIIATTNDYIYFSDDGGASWFDTKFDPTGNTVNDIDVSGMTGGYYYLAAGGVDGAVAELWARELSMKGVWEAQSAKGTLKRFADDQDTILAVAFSPNFQVDRIIGVVSANDTYADFQCYHFEEDLEFWNDEIDGFDDWGTGVSLGEITADLESASIAFISSYDGTDEGERIVFVGLAPETKDIAQKYLGESHGVYRLTDINPTPITNWAGGPLGPIHSVAYHEEGKLLIGDYDENQVFASLDPMVREPSCERVHEYKQPGGEEKTLVAWSGDNAVAATQGDESAFASSDDDGYTFDDISMVNTTPSRVADFANSADGMANYLTTYDTTEGTGDYDVSVWSKVGFAWHRVLSMRDVAVDTEAHWTIRIAPDDPAVILLNPCGTRYIWVNQESGGGKWNKRSCKVDPIQDFIAESADVIYAISTSTFSKSINGGSSWSTEVGFEGKQPYMITLAPNNDILMGTLDGSIIYSKDGGSSFSATAVSGFPVIVAADSNYADNGIVYYNSFTYKPVIARGVLGPMIIPKFIGIDLPDGTEIPAGYGISDLAMVGDALYVLTDNTTNSRLYRALNARDAVDSMKALWGYAESGSLFGHADYQPHPMKIAPNYVDFFTGTAMVKLSFVAYPASVISFGDPLTTQGVTLLAPANEAEVPVNPITGRAYDMTFSWNRFSEDQIVKCDVQVATDPAFDALIVDAAMDGITKDMIAQIIGPNSAYDDFRREFMPNTTYYWRVRVSGIKSGPWLSPWSEVRSFTVAGEIPFAIVSPEVGATGVSITPTLSWTEYPGAISYEVQVADGSIPEGITFAILDVSHSSDFTFYNIEEPLKYSNTYYWRVRAAGTAEWVTGSFTTMAEPVEPEPIIIEPPPVTVQAPPPADITVEAAEPTFPEYLLWTIVGIGAVLVIALIVLIVRTRRVV